jgi:hypothetical protein
MFFASVARKILWGVPSPVAPAAPPTAPCAPLLGSSAGLAADTELAERSGGDLGRGGGGRGMRRGRGGGARSARILKRGTGLLIKGGNEDHISCLPAPRWPGAPAIELPSKQQGAQSLRLQNAAKTAIFRAAETFQRPERLRA